MTTMLPMSPRGERFRLGRRGCRPRRGEDMDSIVSPVSIGAQTWPLMEPNPYAEAGIREGDLVHWNSDFPALTWSSDHPVATLQARPPGEPPPSPTPRLPAWPWAPAYVDMTGDEATQWDAALNVAHRVATVDLRESPHWDRSPLAAGMDLLARILSVKRWGVDGELNGHAVSATWAAGSMMTIRSLTGPVETPVAADGQGWLPTKLDVDLNPGAGGGLNLQLDLLAGEMFGTAPAWRHRAESRGMDAITLDGQPALVPRVRGELHTYGPLDPPPGGWTSTWEIDSVTRRLRREPERIPITLLGIPLMGGPLVGSDDRTPDGDLRIYADEIWGPDEWPG